MKFNEGYIVLRKEENIYEEITKYIHEVTQLLSYNTLGKKNTNDKEVEELKALFWEILLIKMCEENLHTGLQKYLTKEDMSEIVDTYMRKKKRYIMTNIIYLDAMKKLIEKYPKFDGKLKEKELDEIISGYSNSFKKYIQISTREKDISWIDTYIQMGGLKLQYLQGYIYSMSTANTTSIENYSKIACNLLKAKTMKECMQIIKEVKGKETSNNQNIKDMLEFLKREDKKENHM